MMEQPKEFERLNQEKFRVLHWKQFTSVRKRTTVVVQRHRSNQVMVISKGIKHTVTSFCSHLYHPDEPVPITPLIKKEINLHFKKTVAQNLKCLFLSVKHMS